MKIARKLGQQRSWQEGLLRGCLLLGAIFINREVMVFGTIENELLRLFSHGFQVLLAVILAICCYKKKRMPDGSRLAILLVLGCCYMATMVANLDFRAGYFTLPLMYLNCILLFTVFSAEEFYNFFYKAMTTVSAFSLVMYAVQCFFPGMLPLFPKIVNVAGNEYYFAGLTNMWAKLDGGLFYHLKQGLVIRNYGPFREPAVFQSFLVIALLWGILGKKKMRPVSLGILALALITTVSTTGYIALVFVLLAALTANRWNLARRVIALGIEISEKIKRLLRDEKKKTLGICILTGIVGVGLAGLFAVLVVAVKVLGKFFDPNSAQSVLSRFAGFTVNVRMMLESPLWGNGILFADTNFAELAKEVYGIPLSGTNTLFAIGARYGILVFLFVTVRYCFGIRNLFNRGRVSVLCAIAAYMCVLFGSNMQYTILFALPIFTLESDVPEDRRLSKRKKSQSGIGRILYVSAISEPDTQEYSDGEDSAGSEEKNVGLQLCCSLAAGGAEVFAFCAKPVTRKCSRQWFLPGTIKERENIIVQDPGGVNIPVLRQLLQIFQGFFTVLFAPKNTVVIWDGQILPLAYGAVLGAKASGKRNVAVITEIPVFQKQGFRVLRQAACQMLINMADGFLVLTEGLQTGLYSEGKPVCVIGEKKSAEGERNDSCAGCFGRSEKLCEKTYGAEQIQRILKLLAVC